MKLQRELNKGFQEQMDKISKILEAQEELDEKIQKQVAELESITRQIREES